MKKPLGYMVSSFAILTIFGSCLAGDACAKSEVLDAEEQNVKPQKASKRNLVARMFSSAKNRIVRKFSGLFGIRLNDESASALRPISLSISNDVLTLTPKEAIEGTSVSENLSPKAIKATRRAMVAIGLADTVGPVLEVKDTDEARKMLNEVIAELRNGTKLSQLDPDTFRKEIKALSKVAEGSGDELKEGLTTTVAHFHSRSEEELKRANASGSSLARMNLVKFKARAHLNGASITGDVISEAMSLAGDGVVEALTFLGFAYEKGLFGLDRDTFLAAQFYRHAVAANDPTAGPLLKELTRTSSGVGGKKLGSVMDPGGVVGPFGGIAGF
ncbi:MAG: hypothetical protein HOI80_00165 [Alphaproteobacteria bacterium]|nr:hypothetical protein [Alphaproteobacteria bacterium]MBT5389380.1 hypothetical protein [Alphaproteobacteria bacterium]MBT5540551.1 hypothetical protein [Alphaproteobacteria bacterium]MBT5653901.1 hypothetical protein [Alphaproteobacteria bacterium]